MATLESNKISQSLATQILTKYNEERDKRLRERPEGEAQFLDLTEQEELKHFQDDPWIAPDAHTSVPTTIDITKPIKYLIVGAGYSGLLFAVRLLEAGVKLEDLVLIDSSGGFGGVWYWNRYPGLMCDLESYIYMPLLEETGYMPKHKYSYGPELREHANRIAERWNLQDRTIFRQDTKEMNWNTENGEWNIRTKFVGRSRDLDLELRAKYVILAGGQVTRPKIPAVEGFNSFKGHMFHTSRWDYNYTGGSTSDIKPELTKLSDKRVGIIGTGATAVQAVPELAKYAKQLFVIQRTPSSIDARNQQETKPEDWEKIASNKGWWLERNQNFAKILHRTQPQPDVNMVSDNWVIGNPSYCTAWGYDNVVQPDQVMEFVKQMHAGDLPRAERIRNRVDQIVQNKETAQNLKHWYPSWCKRPCFHDDYLPAFNKPNVTLLDTGGHGVEKFTDKGVVVNGVEHELDLIVLATGYKVLGGSSNASPSSRFGIKVIGKDGLNMNDEFAKGISTLHGLCSKGFPNLFFTGAAQTSLTANQIMSMNTFAQHVAYVITEAERLSNSSHVIIEPTKAAEDEWGDRVAEVALGMSAMIGCTPNYFNLEGESDKPFTQGPEAQAKARRAQMWGRGINHYASILGKWRSDGHMTGFDIKPVI
jgi:cation diffusion facilitator CzcD-associated flavoprotein CzcO